MCLGLAFVVVCCGCISACVALLGVGVCCAGLFGRLRFGLLVPACCVWLIVMIWCWIVIDLVWVWLVALGWLLDGCCRCLASVRFVGLVLIVLNSSFYRFGVAV